MKKEESFFKKGFKDSWVYLKESKNFIWTAVIAFFVFAVIGFFAPAPDSISQEILKILRELMDKTKGLSAKELILFILINNISSSFLGIFLGILAGIYSFFAAVFNGYVLGFVARMVVAEENLLSLWRILPHGIFELPAIFISFGLGLKLGSLIFEKEKRKLIKSSLIKSLEVFVFIILPLLIIAAIIEGSLIAILK